MAHEISLNGGTSGSLQFKDLAVGEFGVIKDRFYEGHVVVRTYGDVVVSLTDPGIVWSQLSYVSLTVRRLKPSETITITIGAN